MKTTRLVPCLLGLLLVGAATGLGALINPYIHPTNLIVIFLLSVVLAAVYGRTDASELSARDTVAIETPARSATS